MTEHRAPCGHLGEPIVGTFVRCLTRGCDGLAPQPDPLVATITALLGDRYPAIKRWHVGRHKNGNPMFLIDQFDGNFDQALWPPLNILLDIECGLRCPRNMARFAWQNVKARSTSGRPLFDILRGYWDEVVRNVKDVPNVLSGWTPRSAQVYATPHGPRLKVEIDVPERGRFGHDDYF